MVAAPSTAAMPSTAYQIHSGISIRDFFLERRMQVVRSRLFHGAIAWRRRRQTDCPKYHRIGAQYLGLLDDLFPSCVDAQPPTINGQDCDLSIRACRRSLEDLDAPGLRRKGFAR